MKLYLQPLLKATGALAQLVEQRTENPCVPGSIPGGTTFKNPLQLKRVFLFPQFVIKNLKFRQKKKPDRIGLALIYN